jgi:high-affinity Fe2+/Pb2+ permease
MRFLTPLVFIAIFLGWFLYRLLIKKDARKNLNEILFGFFFIAIWVLLFWYVFL